MRSSHDIEGLLAKFGIKASDVPRIEEALTHGSVNQTGGKLVKNERLAFLGDAVIELAVRNRLFHKYPGESKGNLTDWAHAATNNKALAHRARQSDLALAGYIDVGAGSEKERHEDSVLATAFEAVIGAVYLGTDFQTASKCTLGLLKGMT